MTDAELDHIIATKKKQKNLTDYSEYLSLMLPIMLGLLSCVLIYDQVSKRHADVFTSLYAVLFMIACILLLPFTLKRLHDNTSYQSLVTPFSKKDNYNIALDIFKQSNYRIEEYDKCIVAYVKISLFSWGEMMTVIPLDNEILINSRPTGQPLTIIKDVRNIEKFKAQLDWKIAELNMKA